MKVTRTVKIQKQAAPVVTVPAAIIEQLKQYDVSIKPGDDLIWEFYSADEVSWGRAVLTVRVAGMKPLPTKQDIQDLTEEEKHLVDEGKLTD